MPIRPERAALYPPDWPAISLEVRDRAGWRCEGSPDYPDCRARNYFPHPDTGSIVVLTVAHLDHDPTNNGEPGNRPNLRALCQRCHLWHDRLTHQQNAYVTRREGKAIGDLFQESA
jgi:hypothetical protein